MHVYVHASVCLYAYVRACVVNLSIRRGLQSMWKTCLKNRCILYVCMYFSRTGRDSTGQEMDLGQGIGVVMQLVVSTMASISLYY